MNKPFGEIIMSNLTSWAIQCWQLDDYPSFGALVKIQHMHGVDFGIMNGIETGPKDGSRKPFAFGKTGQELRQEQPHIFQLLQSTVTCIPVSSYKNDKFLYQIPQKPAPIHSFAAQATTEELSAFFSNSLWLSSFFDLARQEPLFDELLLALLAQGYESGAIKQGDLDGIIDTFSLATQGDYRKLKIFLQKIELFIQ